MTKGMERGLVANDANVLLLEFRDLLTQEVPFSSVCLLSVCMRSIVSMLQRCICNQAAITLGRISSATAAALGQCLLGFGDYGVGPPLTVAIPRLGHEAQPVEVLSVSLSGA